MSRILVVDDEPVVRGLVVELLHGAGHEVVTAASGEEALALLDGVDLLVCDVVLPGVSGEAVVAALGATGCRAVGAEAPPAVRASLVAYLDAQDDMVVVGEAENGRQAVELAERETPDFVLMDIRMPVVDGIQATRAIKERRRGTRIVLLSAYEHDELIEAGLEAGAEGFLLKGASGTELVAAIRRLEPDVNHEVPR